MADFDCVLLPFGLNPMNFRRALGSSITLAIIMIVLW